MATRQSNSSTISGHNTYNPPPSLSTYVIYLFYTFSYNLSYDLSLYVGFSQKYINLTTNQFYEIQHREAMCQNTKKWCDQRLLWFNMNMTPPFPAINQEIFLQYK